MIKVGKKLKHSINKAKVEATVNASIQKVDVVIEKTSLWLKILIVIALCALASMLTFSFAYGKGYKIGNIDGKFDQINEDMSYVLTIWGYYIDCQNASSGT